MSWVVTLLDFISIHIFHKIFINLYYNILFLFKHPNVIFFIESNGITYFPIAAFQ